MPTVHKGVGMNRAKKRKLSPLVPVPIFAEDTPEPEEACPAPVPAPSPSPPPTAREEPKQDTRDVSEIEILLYRAVQAKKDFIQVQRRWAKTGRTYLSTAHFFAEHPSELVRTHERLLQADKLHDEAHSKYMLARRKWRLLQTFNTISKRAKRSPENLALQNVALLAETRMLRFELHRLEPGSNVTNFWNPKNIMDVVCSEFGIAQAFGLVWMDQCQGLQGHD